MTLTIRPSMNPAGMGKQMPENARNTKTAQALKRYLDLTLTGTKKNLALHEKNGRKDHPPSPYTFDRPDFEHSIHQALQKQGSHKRVSKTPGWVQQINEKVCNHSGEAPMFTENFLPPHKSEQTKAESRPLSGISTKSAPVVINGEMYYRPIRKHTYLQASNRPSSAKESRLTRASKLRNKHRTQSMSVLPSNDTKMQLRRMKDAKPRPLHLHKDLLPIPCHTGETPHSFIIGARYNCSHFMDSRSFARLGLYVPRQNPLRTFLKTYKGEDGIIEPESESDFVSDASVRGGGSSSKVEYDHIYRRPPKSQHSYQPHVRRVVKEAWLNGEGPHIVKAPSSSVNRHHSTPGSNQPSSKCSTRRDSSKEYKVPSTTPRQEKQPIPKDINVQGQQVTTETGGRSSAVRSPRRNSKVEFDLTKHVIDTDVA